MDNPNKVMMPKKKIRVTLTVALAITLFFGIAPEVVRGADDLSAWGYRTDFRITNLEDGEINGFVFDVSIFEDHFEGRVKEDLTDLRVVDEGLNILPYNLTDNTMKVLDDIAVGETKAYWLYYDNPEAGDDSVTVSFKVYQTIIENPWDGPFHTGGCFYASDWIPGYKFSMENWGYHYEAWEVGWSGSDPLLPYTYVMVCGDGYFPTVAKTFGQKEYYGSADYTGERFAWKNYTALFTGGAYYSFNEDWFDYLFDLKSIEYTQQRLGFKLTTTTSMPKNISYFEIEATKQPTVYLRATPGVPYDDLAYFVSQTDNTYLFRFDYPPNSVRSLNVSFNIYRGDNDIHVYSFRLYIMETPETTISASGAGYRFDPILVSLCILICLVMDLAYLYYKVSGTKDIASGGEALKGVFVFLIVLIIIWVVGYGLITA